MTDFVGDNADNIFTGGAEADTATGNGGNDQLSGNGGNDTLSGDGGADTLNGGDGDDWLYSGTKSPPFNIPYYNNPYTPPVLDTGTEVDTLIGGAGSDRLFAGYGDNVDGGTGGMYGPGDYLYISFQGAPSGVTADFTLATQVIGGGTITGIESVSWIQGSNFADDIRDGGYNGGYNDFTAIFGMGGNDTLTAGYYTGTMDGGEGNDTVDGRGSQYLQFVYGGAGDDTLYTATNTFATAFGGDGNDTIYSHGTTYGGAGDDHIVISFSYYGGYVYGDDGNDTIEASTGGSYLSGGAGADILMGNSGADTLTSGDFPTGNVYPFVPSDDLGLEQDVLTGAGGNDKLSIGYGDSADGGADSDTLRLSLGGLASGIAFNTAGIASGLPFVLGGGTIQNIETFEYLRGTSFDDTLIIATQASLLTVDAGDGNDTITSNNSSVSLLGGNGDELFFSGAAGDVFDGGAGYDTVLYSNYASGISLTAGASGTWTGAGGDQLTSVEKVVGSAYADALTSGGGTVALWGGGGNDTLTAGSGRDELVGQDGDDTIIVAQTASAGEVFEGDAGFDTLELRQIGASSSSFHSLVGASVFQVERVVFASSVSTTIAASLLYSQVTNQPDGGQLTHVVGGSGIDLLTITTGILSVGGTFEIPALNLANWTSSATPLLTPGDMIALSATGTGNFTLMAREGLATTQGLYGGNGNDTLIGSSGVDLLSGGGGDDVLIGGFGQAGVPSTDQDSMAGGTGNDTFYIDHPGDMLVEQSGQGYDVAISRVGYGLAAGVSVEVLMIENGANISDNFQLSGNEFGNLIYGTLGNNRIDGGGGQDTMVGYAGDDTFYVDHQSDTIVEQAGQGYDTVIARASYSLNSGASVEVIMAENGNSITDPFQLSGNELSNLIYGTLGNNVLNGGGGPDILVGYAGDDIYVVDNAGDQIFEAPGEGRDMVSTGISLVLAAGLSIEILQASGSAALNLTGNELDNLIYGNSGSNVLAGGAGVDVMVGGAGNDVFHVENGLETVYELAGQGYDTVYVAAGSYVLNSTAEVEVLAPFDVSLTTALNFTGNGFNNLIYGNAGNNVLTGGGGIDHLVGNGGNDSFVVDDALDTVYELAGEGYDIVYATASYTLPGAAAVEVLAPFDISLTTAFAFTGNGFNNLIYGNAGSNVLTGGDGIDQLVGLAGDDALNGGTGDDTLYGEAGADTLTGGSGNDTFTYSNLAHSLAAGGDLITDFAAGDRIDLSAIDADSAAAGDQAFHLGATAGHTGDVVVAFDAINNFTSVSLFVDGDAVADAVIYMSGNLTTLTAADFVL